MTFVLPTLNVRQNLRQYSAQISKSCCRQEREGAKRAISSANRMHAINICNIWQPILLARSSLMRSLIYSEKKSGDSMPPCLVPQRTENRPERALPHLHSYSIFIYQNMIIIRKHSGILRSINLMKRPWCEMVSNAFEKSQNVTKTSEPLFVKKSTQDLSAKTAWSVPCFGLKPNCKSSLTRKWPNLSLRAFSNKCENVPQRVIPR